MTQQPLTYPALAAALAAENQLLVAALECTITTLRDQITTLRAQIAPHDAKLTAAEKAMRELESANSTALQLDARIKELEGQLDAGGVEPLRKRECLHKIAEPDHFRGATEMVQASAPVVLPAPDVFAKVSHKGAAKRDVEFIWPVGKLEEDGDHKLYTEQQVRAMLATGGQAQEVPNGWREQFATEVYADLEAADNQDVPLEEYPARILKVLDSTVGPRHPMVIKWRNDAIEQCIAIARKYCRDPESHKYLKQDLEAMLTAEPAPQAQAAALDALRMWLDIHETPAGFAGKYGKAFDDALAAQQLKVDAAASAARAAIAKATGGRA